MNLKIIKKNILKFIDNYQQKKINLALRKILKDELITLIDIGAAEGIQSRWKVISNFVNYIGFEPDERSYYKLNNIPKTCKKEIYFNHGVWDYEGKIKLNLCKKPTVSSYFKPNKKVINNFNDASRFEIVNHHDIYVKTLDLLNIPNPDFVKIDIQGGELNVLKGAEETLKNCIGIELETEFIDLYEKQPLFGDILNYLSKKDFEFIDFTSINRWGRQEFNGFGQAIFADALFLKSPEKIIQEKNINVEILKKYFCICLIYNKYDLAIKINQLYLSKFRSELVDKNIFLNLLIHNKRIIRLNNIFQKILRIIKPGTNLHLFN